MSERLKDPGPPAPKRRAPPTLPLRGASILVVDDDEDGREAVAALLMLAGAQVRTAAGGLEALETLRTWSPTLLLSDLAMPDGDGYLLVRAVRSLRGSELPAVALSGAASAADRELTRRAGFDAHLAKPVDPGELIAVLSQLARTARAARYPEH